ncbi:class I SAM-dependent methyltransferase [Alsobacter sp. R-9]
MSELRRLLFGFATLSGIAERGFFIPYRYAGTVRPGSYPAIEPLFDTARPRFAAMLADIETHAETLAKFGKTTAAPGSPKWSQDWFPRLDAAAAYAIVRRERPRRIVEIGSGHSTRFLARAVADGGLSTEIVCIDPAPRAPLGQLKVNHVKRVFGDADTPLATALGPGDILFIDSSHIAMPGSDVDRLVLDVLPRLQPGVLVHVHDVLLPDGYPEVWAWRGYNEQTVIGALLQGGAFDLVFGSHFVATRMADLVAAGVLGRLPLKKDVLETSLWLRKR